MTRLVIETHIHAPVDRCFDLARDVGAHTESAAFSSERVVEPGRTQGFLELGDLVAFEGRHFGIRQRFVAKITALDRPHRFVDEMVEGAFKWLRHVHEFETNGDTTLMRDILEWEAPFGIVGSLADVIFLRRHMRWFVTTKQSALKRIAEASAVRGLDITDGMNSILPEIIETNRLLLRPPIIADAAIIFRAYTQDKEVCRYMIWAPHDSVEVTRNFIADCLEAWKGGVRLPYSITMRESQDPIGMIEARLQNTTVDIGYVLARAHWGKGLMPEAIRAIAETSLLDPGIFRVQAFCDCQNIASQRALEKAGFLREGRLERFMVHPNLSPEPRACFMYARCK
jgi:RimJ/RimL family protein N-acetyltransferase/ligand-binding SRPBCC domain-containing protein